MSRQPEQPVRTGKTNKTPAPTNNSGAVKYGANQFGSVSSDVPGQRTRAALTVNNDDSDPVLAGIRERGAKSSENYSNAQSLPITPGNSPSTPNPARVPSGCGGCED
jgi:hypothetical protein